MFIALRNQKSLCRKTVRRRLSAFRLLSASSVPDRHLRSVIPAEESFRCPWTAYRKTPDQNGLVFSVRQKTISKKGVRICLCRELPVEESFRNRDVSAFPWGTCGALNLDQRFLFTYGEKTRERGLTVAVPLPTTPLVIRTLELFLFLLRFLDCLPLPEITLVFCVPRLLTFRPITVLLLSGIANKESAAVVAANQNSVPTPVI